MFSHPLTNGAYGVLQEIIFKHLLFMFESEISNDKTNN